MQTVWPRYPRPPAIRQNRRNQLHRWKKWRRLGLGISQKWVWIGRGCSHRITLSHSSWAHRIMWLYVDLYPRERWIRIHSRYSKHLYKMMLSVYRNPSLQHMHRLDHQHCKGLNQSISVHLWMFPPWHRIPGVAEGRLLILDHLYQLLRQQRIYSSRSSMWMIVQRLRLRVILDQPQRRGLLKYRLFKLIWFHPGRLSRLRGTNRLVSRYRRLRYHRSSLMVSSRKKLEHSRYKTSKHLQVKH